LDAMAKTPNKSAAQMFSHAAAANPAVFYRKDGTARSVREVYDRFDQRMDEDIALFDGLDDGAPAIGKQNPSESAPKMLAAAVGSLASKIHPVSVLSPAILVALASLPVLRGGDKEDTGNKRSLFEQSLMSKPLA